MCAFLKSYFTIPTDHDECAGNIHGCHQGCVNYPGGYNCSCKSGYRLNTSDFKSCDGKVYLPRINLNNYSLSKKNMFKKGRRLSEVVFYVLTMVGDYGSADFSCDSGGHSDAYGGRT